MLENRREPERVPEKRKEYVKSSCIYIRDKNLLARQSRAKEAERLGKLKLKLLANVIDSDALKSDSFL